MIETNQLNLRTSICRGKSDTTTTEYTFDTVNNRIKRIVSKEDKELITEYDYDNQNRLKKEKTKDSTGNIKSTVYKYDYNGNLIFQSDEVLEVITPELADASFAMFIIGQGSTKELEYGIRLYHYDSLNRLVEATANGDKTTYLYDGMDRRVKKTVNGAYTNYLYNGDKIILEKAGNKTTTRNIYSSSLIAREDNQDKAYYSYNGHGDVVGLYVNTIQRAEYKYNAFGIIKEEKYYDTDGNEINKSLINTPYRYNSYRYDEETGNYFLNVRYYNPSIGRFISEDSYRGNIEFVMSLNLYTYCCNEPIMYIDPTGHFMEHDSSDMADDLDLGGSSSVRLGNTTNDGSVTAEEVVEQVVKAAEQKSTTTIEDKAEPKISTQERIDHGVSGGMRIGIGTTAMIAAFTVITGGTGGIIVMLAAGATMVAGATTTTIGVAEVEEGITGGHNFVRDEILQGNEELYNNVDQGAMLVATAGTVYCNGVNYNNNLKETLGVEGTGKLDDLISAKSLGKGSTGRTVANSLDEQLAMKEVLSNPLDGAEHLRKFKMGDTRWSGNDGWQKMQRIIQTSDGTKINIHYNYNKLTGAFDDFKFKQTILPK